MRPVDTWFMYRLGYLVYEKGAAPFSIPESLSHWMIEDMGDHILAHDPNLAFQTIVDSDVFLLGTAWHIRGESIGETLRQAYRSDEKAVLDVLDDLAGRYLFFYRLDGNLQVTQDALGMRSLFYSVSSRCLGSHYHLIRAVTGKKEPFEDVSSVLKRKVTSNMIPGHFTPDREIFMLTPNQAMDLKTFVWHRIFPRHPHEDITVDEAVESIDRAVRCLLEQIKQRLLVPITAGLDSRSTLALLRCQPSHQYFTYSQASVRSLQTDLNVAIEIARTFQLPHVKLHIRGDFGKNEDEKNFMSLLRKVTIRRHSFEVAWRYVEHFESDYLHIRSNGYEVGRRYYRQAFSLPDELSAEGIARTFSRTAVKDETVLELSQRFIDQAKLSDHLNYDPYDLYYWEHRMGTWHASLLLESDLAHDSFILINSRHILKQLLSVSDEAQSQGEVQKRLIERFAPRLLDFAIN